ncbi:hypothetical protein [Lentzea albida]|uniref:hypothetical protein n=1 Tax=Lentzea albida TaxID=65499 RepID=UPI000B7D2E74|nr:hypothetical protein [Lentzea albida]
MDLRGRFGQLFVLRHRLAVRSLALHGDEARRLIFLEADEEVVRPQQGVLTRPDLGASERPPGFKRDVGVDDLKLVVRMSPLDDAW